LVVAICGERQLQYTLRFNLCCDVGAVGLENRGAVVTTMVSDTLPGWSVTSTQGDVLASRLMFCCPAFLNPAALTVMVWTPGCISGKV
jgi:hypothetical protein